MSVIKRGESYLVMSDDLNKAYCLIGKLMTSSKKSMVISRNPVKTFPESAKLKNVRVKWITNIKTDKEHLSPHDLEQLSYDIEKFIKTNKDCVVVLSCVEYLISFNSFNNILHLIQTLKDINGQNGSIFLVFLGINTLSIQEEKLLMQELTVAGDVNG